MFGNILHFIINIVFSLFGIALIIRAWMYAIRLHPFNPYAQAVLRITDWLVQPIKKVIPASKFLDWPSLLAAYLTALVFLLLTFFVLTGHLPVVNGLLGALVASFLTVLKWAFNLVLWLTLIQVVLSWVNPMAPLMPVLQTLTAPLLDPIRRILPSPGGIDFSPLVLLIVAQVVMMVLEGFAYRLFGV
ncbi:YggT family protein [Pusillimonas sp. NJUB218]|uniref:YggT family protein n=1 Tax=Pusillimonas sp. NJUB218 TaxID=2023230 RepID=UPI000F4BBC6E|nr:YggT family protein [Pusillimonas sp. NJUB218]ROT44803.1 hypothetical protein CHR62_10240 [Pusillimonas sp. NJUB218]